MHYAFRLGKRDLHHGDRYLAGMDTPNERLRFARLKAGYETAKAAAEAMGASVSTYIQHENGARGFPAGKAERYATFFHIPPEWLLYGRGQPPKQSVPPIAGLKPVNRSVPVIGVVQAGLWQEVVDGQQESEELLPINLQGFEQAQLYALRVSGPSMNLIYPEGTRVVICPVAEIGVREGDHVVIRRRQGAMVETTLKEVVQGRAGIELWPKSSDPRYQDPIRHVRRVDADDGFEVIGVVVAAYFVRPQQTRPLIQF